MLSLEIVEVLVYIPTAPSFVPNSIDPVFFPVFATVPLTNIPTPDVPTFNAPEEARFIFSAYIAVPLSKLSASIFKLILLSSVPLVEPL